MEQKVILYLIIFLLNPLKMLSILLLMKITIIMILIL